MKRKINKKTTTRLTFFIKIIIIIYSCSLFANENDEYQEFADYSVEIIIFKYFDEDTTGNELFIQEQMILDKNNLEAITDDPITNNLHLDNEILSNTSSYPFYNQDYELIEIPTDKKILFQTLNKESLSLGAIYNRLNRLRVYEPIIWNGWEQLFLKRKDTSKINLRRLKNTLGEFTGTFELYESIGGKARLSINIEMNEKDIKLSSTDEMQIEQDDQQNINTNIGIKYPLSDDKEIKHDELRYFDHPKFGVIAKITKKDSSKIKQMHEMAQINPEQGNVFNKSSKNEYVSAIERGIVGLSKTGKYISLTLRKDGEFTTNISDQLEIDKLDENEIVMDSFVYIANDGKKNTEKELVVEITGINDPPTSENKIIAIDNPLPYKFNIDDFSYNDIEEKELDHITITKLPETMDLYEEYPFGTWPLKEGMKVYKNEIEFLRYNTSENGVSDSSFYFLVNDGKQNSIVEYKIEFTSDVDEKTELENTVNLYETDESIIEIPIN